MARCESPHDALLAAIQIAGTQVDFAALLKVAQGTVSKWVKKGRGLPAEHALAVEAATGVSRYDLAPQFYPRESGAPDQLEGLRA